MKASTLLRKAGFKYCSLGYWENAKGIRIAYNGDDNMTLEQLVQYVSNQAAYWTRRRIKRAITLIDCGTDEFIPHNS